MPHTEGKEEEGFSPRHQTVLDHDMSWWFYAAALRDQQLQEDILLCREARAIRDRFPDAAADVIQKACTRAEERVGPRAMRTEFKRLHSESKKKHNDDDLARTTAAIAMCQELADNKVQTAARWSMLSLAQAFDEYENGSSQTKEPSADEVYTELGKVVDAINAISWEKEL